MMTRLLTILSGTLLLNVCPNPNSPVIESGYTLLGYYNIGTYDIHICMFGDRDTESIQAHELGHLFRFMYLGKNGTKEQYEGFASAFSSCRMDIKCRPFLKSIVTETIEKKK